MQRLDYIDQLKGFAILCVVIGHVMLFCVKSTESSLCYQVITSFHMPLFAFLSGLMFKRQIDVKQTLGKFGKQSIKLLVPFLVVGLLYTYGMLHLGGVSSSRPMLN